MYVGVLLLFVPCAHRIITVSAAHTSTERSKHCCIVTFSIMCARTLPAKRERPASWGTAVVLLHSAQPAAHTGDGHTTIRRNQGAYDQKPTMDVYQVCTI